MGTPVVIIDSKFCDSNAVDLRIHTPSAGKYLVFNLKGNLMFSVNKGGGLHLHSYLVLLDAAGNAILTFQDKNLTMHQSWQVFNGDSTDSKDLLFTAKKHSMIRVNTKTELDVFMAANTEQNSICDFKVKGSLSDECAILLGETVLAQTHKKHGVLGVTVNPGVDYAFVVALVVILHEINEEAKAAIKNVAKSVIHQGLSSN